MNQTRHHPRIWVFLLLSIGLALVGCAKQPTAQPTASGPAYSGALDTTYANALDPLDQLALGTLDLEGTADAVTQEQAAGLLPLWQALQGTVLQGNAERMAAIEQIEKQMTDSQIRAIVAMHLTQESVQTWLASQGNRFAQGGGGTPSPGGRQRPAGTPQSGGGQQFQNMTTEQLATRRAQFAGQAGQGGTRQGSSSAGPSYAAGLSRAVIALLMERSGQAAAARTPAAGTPSPTAMALPSRAEPSPTAAATAEPAPTATPTPEPTSTPEATPSPTATAAATSTPTPAATRASASSGTSAPVATPTAKSVAAPLPALAQVKDTNPGPPFTVQISMNQATQDPLVEKSEQYKITGLVRNDGTQTYDVSSIQVTFFDANGFRGTFHKYPKVPGGEWIWHGLTDAEFGCMLLAPGESCPFSVEITAQDMASFLIHPNAEPTGREPVAVKLSNVRLGQDEADFVRIQGTVTNAGSVKAKNVTVVGALIDAQGQINSVGFTYVVQGNIEPGASVPFDLRVERQVFARYQLYAQAERDWQ
jgi:hypothetical protein